INGLHDQPEYHATIGVGLAPTHDPSSASDSTSASVSSTDCPATWNKEELHLIDALASIIALLLENSRLLERDRERIYELSLLNSICSQMNHSLYDLERLRNIILQRMREIARVDVCALIEATNEAELPDWLSNPLWSLLIQQAHEQYLIAP